MFHDSSNESLERISFLGVTFKKNTLYKILYLDYSQISLIKILTHPGFRLCMPKGYEGPLYPRYSRLKFGDTDRCQ